MRRLILIQRLVLAMGLLVSTPNLFAQSDQTEFNTEAVAAYVTAYAAHDYVTMEKYLADDAVFEDPANQYEGKEQFMAGMRANKGGASDTGIAPEEILKLRSGNNYIMASRIDFNLLMAPGGSPEKEYHFNLNFVIMLKLENGLIVRHDDFVDSDAFMAQLGEQMAQ